MFKKLSRKEFYKDNWVTLYQDKIEFPDGSLGTYAWVNRKDGVAVVVVTKDNKILLNREYRYVINSYSWEIPGGGIDEGETPEDAAIRELYEETGVKVENVKRLGRFYPLHSFNTETIDVFYSTVATTSVTSKKSEAGEHIDEQKYVTFEEALQMIDIGEISDAITATALQMAIRKLQNNHL